MTRRRLEREHGTARGYWQHLSASDTPCEPCREARNAYQREYRANRRLPAADEVRRRYMAARGRAMTRLAQAHPDEFRRYMSEELGS